MVALVVVSAYAWRLEGSRFDSARGYICQEMLVILIKALAMVVI